MGNNVIPHRINREQLKGRKTLASCRITRRDDRAGGGDSLVLGWESTVHTDIEDKQNTGDRR